ncbi:hypothetical protein OS493_021144 [Desmophyllum pertusum]|uniref:Uncharacterized protein n=1 Tax=Desmophyllum pertusum TaxID=174260 RepID=A0A9W9ZN96_9CNID|nr:hypothetical protein OS493_021144 [Desmophyllum pertusum]
MKRVPEILMQVYEALIHNNMPSHNSNFAVEKSKPRSMSPASTFLLQFCLRLKCSILMLKPKHGNLWHPQHRQLRQKPNVIVQSLLGRACLLLAADSAGRQYIYRYDTECNVWEKQPHSCSVINNLCILEDYMYAISLYSAYPNQVPQSRYNFATRQWQSIAKVGIRGNNYLACNGGAIVHSKVLVLYGDTSQRSGSVLNCFDPVKNEWEVKATTCHLHFGSSLFVVNSRLYVAGGCISGDANGSPHGNPAPVEVYDEKNNTWSVVEQKHIPSNNLGAVEIEGRVYFIINKFSS